MKGQAIFSAATKASYIRRSTLEFEGNVGPLLFYPSRAPTWNTPLRTASIRYSLTQEGPMGVTKASREAPTLTSTGPAPHRAVRGILLTPKSSRYWPTSTFIPIAPFAIAMGCDSSMPSSIQVAVTGKNAPWLGEGKGITIAEPACARIVRVE
jgi:hypothetical protein